MRENRLLDPVVPASVPVCGCLISRCGSGAEGATQTCGGGSDGHERDSELAEEVCHLDGTKKSPRLDIKRIQGTGDDVSLDLRKVKTVLRFPLFVSIPCRRKPAQQNDVHGLHQCKSGQNQATRTNTPSRTSKETVGQSRKQSQVFEATVSERSQ